ncbi:hypothetical protein LXA43DRAFT_1020956 [Ganoderma leucocontextum]|nr:hypothetical protein LXA43DRAFT_1020956 [Ganoderma leucocontextum]
MAGLPLDQVLSAPSRALQRSSVSHLLLEFCSLEDFGKSEGVTGFYRNAGRGMELLSRSIPSLRKIFFDIEGRDLKAWELATGGSGEWQEMDEWEALRVISVEGMRDSGRDN